ncbi:monooxygenase [Streptomyces sp. DT2A-34]|uniref:NAD(P)/FAD-dependent oxidoreductase n=1 Tax=Streptomyces sp. DT2A-34 TaxID=3051182 RepID=UPI00265C1E52|nr:monooxygenase [Streptomyces sp. DT2A-34]MDO0917539.1 monooxygenase [Streptomyces sp. DT2A-34]
MSLARLAASRKARHGTPSRRDHAIVIGAGFAGLLATRVLADHFAQVTLLERDTITDEATFRRGTPQSYHAHYLLERGALTLEELCPGVREEMAANGVPMVDFGEAMRFLLPSGWTPQTTTGISVQSLSRPFLEQQVRRRVLKLPNVELISDFTVDALVVAEGSESAVRGVRGRHEGTPRDFTGDLVVIATGRGPQLPKWLADAGIPSPAERRVAAEVAYTTRLYDGHPDEGFTARAVLAYAPDRRRAGGVVTVEHGRCLVTLCGADGEKCDISDTGFEAFAESLPDSCAADYLKTHTPLNRAHRFVDHGNRWRLLHRDHAWPTGLVALGDCLCLFNPIYGQGLTVAALQAQALGVSLGRGESARQFQSRAARIIRIPWLMATSSDLAWESNGMRLVARMAHWYLGRLLQLIPTDPDLYRRFARVQHMRDAPTALMAPAVLRRAFLARQPNTRK